MEEINENLDSIKEIHMNVPVHGLDSIEPDLHYLLDKATKKALDNIEIDKEEKLESILSSILEVIKRFRDCSSQEEFRTLAKKSDGTLATITMMDPSSGFLLYKTIGLDLKDYKEFYFETLGYALAYYLLFYRNNEFDIISKDDESKTGKFRITDEAFPHLLGLENKFVSKKECPLLNKIIPGYNDLSILDKIHALVFNYEKIIQFEEDHNIDIFNYYKNMQKNKDFLLMGRFVPDFDLTDDMFKVYAVPHNNNQVILYKKSNNNSVMDSSISKLLLQQLEDGSYFPRSMQRVSLSMLDENEAKKILEKGITLFDSGYSFEVSANYPETYSCFDKPSIEFHFTTSDYENCFLHAFEDVLPLAEPPELDPVVLYNSEDYFDSDYDHDNFESDDEIFSLLNSNLPDNVIKSNIIKAMNNDIVYGEDIFDSDYDEDDYKLDYDEDVFGSNCDDYFDFDEYDYELDKEEIKELIESFDNHSCDNDTTSLEELGVFIKGRIPNDNDKKKVL